MTGLARFSIVLAPAALGGALWNQTGLPLGWLMGAAVVSGAFVAFGMTFTVPEALYKVSLALLGASVGIAISPDVAAVLLAWLPIMVLAALAGILCALLFAPMLERMGGMSRSTAFFALLPGGVIEMATVGSRFGADTTIVATLHAVRVGLVVSLLPLALFFLADVTPVRSSGSDSANWSLALLPLLLVAIAGGWLASLIRMPAAWLLGAVLLVGVVSSLGTVFSRVPPELIALVQVVVGVQLGARFQRSQLSAVPSALVAGLPVLLIIMVVMACLAALASLVLPFSLSTLVLCFSIGGMAEMVLTSKALGQDFALVAAFQAVRGVLVNASAGAVWRRLSLNPSSTNLPKGKS